MGNASTVIVVGGGIMGLLAARELSRRGMSVTLLEQQRIGREASWAGGGIISPLYPWRYSQPVTALAHQAQGFYPTLCEQLHRETGIDPEFHPCGLLMVDAEDRSQALDWLTEQQRTFEQLDGAELRQRFPHLNPAAKEAIWMPHIGNVRNPRLLQALVYSLRNNTHKGAPVTLLERQGVDQVGSDARGPFVTVNGERISADHVIVATGAWTAQLLAGSRKLPIWPVRGQMLCLAPQPGLLQTMILQQGKYLIPRKDGRILVGSTLEETGFVKGCTDEARENLFSAACAMLPELASAVIEHHWSGLRPGSPQGIPVIGELPEMPGVWVNAGHFRNGLVLAPAATQLLVDLLTGKVPGVDPAPYAPPA